MNAQTSAQPRLSLSDPACSCVICKAYKHHNHAAPGGLRHPFVDALPRQVHLSSPRDGCSPPDMRPPPQSILLSERGNCTFLEKAQVAADLDAVGLIIINNSSDCLYPELKGNGMEDLSRLFIASAPLDETTQALIDAAAEQQPRATYSSIRTAILDPAALGLLCLAVVTIIAAAAWAGSEFKRALALQEEQDSLNAPSAGQLGGNAGQEGSSFASPVLLDWRSFPSLSPMYPTAASRGRSSTCRSHKASLSWVVPRLHCLLVDFCSRDTPHMRCYFKHAQPTYGRLPRWLNGRLTHSIPDRGKQD